MNKPQEVEVPKVAPTRDELRAILIGSTPKGKSKLIEVFGVELELRQPTLAAIMQTRDETDTAQRAVGMIIEYAFVPGTDEHVFEDTDAEFILRWPFGEDLTKINAAIAELTGIDIGAAEEALVDPLAGSS